MNRIEAKERMKAALRTIVEGAKALVQIEEEIIADGPTTYANDGQLGEPEGPNEHPEGHHA